MQVTRRGIVLGIGAAGGLVLAWSLLPRRYGVPLAAGADETAFNAWIKIAHDGAVTVAVPQLEMGQGVTTLLPQIVAMELGADWRQVAVEMAPPSGAYANVPLAEHWASLWMPAFPSLATGEGDNPIARRWAESGAFTATADGSTLAAYEMPARIAAASARALLAKAAAARWDVEWEECEAQDGFVLHDKRRLSFADLVEDAAGHTPPDPPVLRAAPPAERAAEFPAGAPLRYPRLDLAAKVDGSATFAGDVRLPGMAFAAIRHAPIGEARLGHVDREAARGMPGFQRLVEGPAWLAAVGDTWWAAEAALRRIAPRFAGLHRADSAKIAAQLAKALKSGSAATLVSTGDGAAALGPRPEAMGELAIAPALHAGIETASATARIDGGKAELWVASQAPQALREAVASALGIEVRDVVLYPVPAGGSFDARLDHTHAVEAALIARAAGKPIQLTWSRWQEMVAVAPRAPARARFAGGFGPDGSVQSLALRIATPASAREFGARLFGGATPQEALDQQDGADPLAAAGLIPPYAIPNLVVEHVPVRLPLPTGRLRGNAHGVTCFVVETAIDALARASGREPLSFRMALLGGDLRLAQCLQRAASLAQWNGSAAGSGEGLACHLMSFGAREGRIAVIAHAHPSEQGITVEKLTAVADIGRIVNADLARQQIEGGLVFGLGLALGATARYAHGLPETGRLGALGLPSLATCPEIEVDFIDSTADPFDPGELGVAAVAPAVASALRSVTGSLIATLPLTGAGQ